MFWNECTIFLDRKSTNLTEESAEQVAKNLPSGENCKPVIAP